MGAALHLAHARQVPAPRGYGRATLTVTLDVAEHERRQTATLGGITSYAVLDLLMQLPIGFPVPVGALAVNEQRLLRRMPTGVMHVDSVHGRPAHVTRLAVKPAVVEVAVVEGRLNAETLGRATGFAPFCRRSILAPVRPSVNRLAEADYWGVGVTLDCGDDREVLVEPQPWRPMRHTAAGWLFAERAYRAAVGGELLGGVS